MNSCTARINFFAKDKFFAKINFFFNIVKKVEYY